MASLVSQNIKNLVQGVSQQPAFIRYPEQLEEQINGLSTEVDGLQKRPPTIFKKKLDGITPDISSGKALVHFVNRDKLEKYIVCFVNNSIFVYDTDGNRKNVTIQSGTEDYLKTSNPQQELQVRTVGDYTFVLNKTKVTRMTDKKSGDSFNHQGNIVYVRQGQYGRTYRIRIGSNTIAEFKTPNGDNPDHTQQIDTSYIADKLTEQARGKGVTVYHDNNWLQIMTQDDVNTTDGFNNQALICFKNTIQTFSKLPATAPNGYLVKVMEDPNGSRDGSYYVQYDSSRNVWRETAAPNINVELDKNTMPHGLIRQADGSFLFKTLDWAERKIGDEDTNPLPSFVNHTISNIFFYQNRLGFSSRENVIMSESANYFNMWMTTANDLLDTDCIDISVASTKANVINFIAIYAEDLYAFTDDTQFVLRTSTVLSPKTSSMVEITQFNSSPICQPQVNGKNMYFTVEKGNYTSVNEYYTVQDVSQLKNAQDISAHIPNYIPKGVYEIVSSTISNMLLFLTTGNTKGVYIYKYLFTNETRVQSAWSKWLFFGDVIGLGFIKHELYLVIRRGNVINLEVIDLSTDIKDFENDEKYRVFLDCKKVLKDIGTYDDKAEKTTFDIKALYGYSDVSPFPNNQISLVNSEGKYLENIKITDEGTISLEGDVRKDTFIVGIPYLFYIQFSPFYLKYTDSSGNLRSRVEGRTQIKYINLQYDKSGYFEAWVSSNGKFSYLMTSKLFGTSSTKFNKLLSSTGIFRFPVHARNTDVTVCIQTSYPLPVSLVGLSWECVYVTKARGV